MSLINLVRQAGLGAVESTMPVAIRFGTVTKTNPLEINVEQHKPLDQSFLTVTEQLTEYKVTVNGETITIRRGLQVGDRVVLVRIQGSGKYIVFDRVV